jgi:N-acetyl-gamma-glutamyl-phosphate reductase
VKVGIVGGTGYTGAELLRLLAMHPSADVVAITSRGEKGVPVAQLYPNLRGIVDLAFIEPDIALLADCDVVFFATPSWSRAKYRAGYFGNGNQSY